MRKTTKMILKRLKEVQKRREMREEMNSRAASEKEKGGASQGQNPAAQARARTMLLMQEMPGVCTAGLPRTVEGFLYKYKTGHVVIVCLCHGSFLTLEDFVKHAGAVNVENAMRQIVMKPAAP